LNHRLSNNHLENAIFDNLRLSGWELFRSHYLASSSLQSSKLLPTFFQPNMPIDNMSSSIRPQYFVTREDGTITPLVAMDELPIYVAVRGVPRVLRAADTVGMTSLGTVQTRGQYYVVDGVQPDIVGEATDRFDPNSSLQVANPQTMVSAWHMTTKHEKRTNSKDKKVNPSEFGSISSCY
jgi:hypothetical protein